MNIQIPMRRPHSKKQADMIAYPGNVVALCGRRFGKTDGYAERLFHWMQKRPGLYWWVGLSWRSASLKRAWREVTFTARRVLQALDLPEREHINRSNYEIRLPGLGEIWFRTADNPASLAGEGVMGVVLDEFTLMRPEVWEEYVEATLLDYGGWAAFGGVPKGNNWGANLWRAAADRTGWLQVHASTYENPFIEKARVDAIREHASERFFQQEYMALITDDAGGVFRRVMDAATGTEQAPVSGRQYLFGVDWGKSNDFTVITVVDVAARAVVYLDRFNQIDYALQTQRLKVLRDRYRPGVIIAEANAMGGPLVEQLWRDGLPVQPFTTTNATKAQIIDDLALAFERGEITILNDDVLINELQAYEMTRLPSGLFRYSAPEGLHDDCVMSLALAWSGIQNSGSILL